jgi:hypothetical protein
MNKNNNQTSIKKVLNFDEKSLKRMKNNNLSFKVYLKKYNAKFDGDLDELWKEVDLDKNGFLDEDESLQFLIEVSKVI